MAWPLFWSAGETVLRSPETGKHAICLNGVEAAVCRVSALETHQ